MTPTQAAKRIQLVIPLILTVLTSACAPALQQLQHADDLRGNEMVIAGRIELVPRLHKNDQMLHSHGSGQYRNKAIFVIGENLIDIYDFDYKSLEDSALVGFNRDFHIRVPRHSSLVYSGALIVAESRNGGGTSFIHLPGRLNIRVHKNDRALYLGTIRYYRNDFNEIVKVRIINGYRSFNTRFRKRFGDRIRLRKARLRR